MGIGKGSGKTRAKEAAVAAVSSPLLDFPMHKAKGVMYNIVGGPDLTLDDVCFKQLCVSSNILIECFLIIDCAFISGKQCVRDYLRSS